MIGGKTFEELGFRVGEKVRCVAIDDEDIYAVGDEATLNLKQGFPGYSGCDGSLANWEHVEFVPHDGGPCPVPDGTRGAVRLGGGSEHVGAVAILDWEHLRRPSDITHYKVLAPESGADFKPNVKAHAQHVAKAMTAPDPTDARANAIRECVTWLAQYCLDNKPEFLAGAMADDLLGCVPPNQQAWLPIGAKDDE